MNNEATRTAPNWYVLYTNPKQEDRAECNLRAWGVKTFIPRFKESRYNEYTRERSYLIKPLFPRYIFAKFNLDEMFHNVRFTRGVHSVVSFSGKPTPCEEAIIAVIEERVGEDGFVRLNDECKRGNLKPGDRVVITDGVFQKFTGIFEREMEESDRVLLLLNAVAYQARIVIERNRLSKAG